MKKSLKGIIAAAIALAIVFNSFSSVFASDESFADFIKEEVAYHLTLVANEFLEHSDFDFIAFLDDNQISLGDIVNMIYLFASVESVRDWYVWHFEEEWLRWFIYAFVDDIENELRVSGNDDAVLLINLVLILAEAEEILGDGLSFDIFDFVLDALQWWIGERAIFDILVNSDSFVSTISLMVQEYGIEGTVGKFTISFDNELNIYLVEDEVTTNLYYWNMLLDGYLLSEDSTFYASLMQELQFMLGNVNYDDFVWDDWSHDFDWDTWIQEMNQIRLDDWLNLWSYEGDERNLNLLWFTWDNFMHVDERVISNANMGERHAFQTTVDSVYIIYMVEDINDRVNIFYRNLLDESVYIVIALLDDFGNVTGEIIAQEIPTNSSFTMQFNFEDIENVIMINVNITNPYDRELDGSFAFRLTPYELGHPSHRS